MLRSREVQNNRSSRADRAIADLFVRQCTTFHHRRNLDAQLMEHFLVLESRAKPHDLIRMKLEIADRKNFTLRS